MCFEYISTLHSFSQIYSNLPLYKMTWNSFFLNLLPRLYYNIIWKNIVKIFRKFEVGYIQTYTSLESGTMWHPKGGHCSVLLPTFKGQWANLMLHMKVLESMLDEPFGKWKKGISTKLENRLLKYAFSAGSKCIK